jgi:DNA-binding transcriptional MerR regulator
MTALPRSFTVSELSAATKIPLPRIKFYLREALLPPADLSAEKRAFYDERHAQRLRLIHTLRQVAGLSVPAIRALCRELDDPRGDILSAVLHVIDALGRDESKTSTFAPAASAKMRAKLRTYLAGRGLKIRPQSPALAELSRALLGLHAVLDVEVPPEALAPYLEAMLALADHDLAATRNLISDPASAALAATFGTVLYEPVLLLLRRLAHEHVAYQHLASATGPARTRGRS